MLELQKGSTRQYNAQYNTIQLYIALSCALHCLVHCIILSIALYCALHYIVHCIVLCIVFYCALYCLVHYTVLCIALPYALHCLVHCIILSIALYCALHYIRLKTLLKCIGIVGSGLAAARPRPAGPLRPSRTLATPSSSEIYSETLNFCLQWYVLKQNNVFHFRQAPSWTLLKFKKNINPQ